MATAALSTPGKVLSIWRSCSPKLLMRCCEYPACNGFTPNFTSGRTITDMPVRQIYYFGTEGEQPGGEAGNTNSLLMASYSDGTIETYVASGAPFDKAGAYAIQDLEGALVDGVVGSYTNVVGLPVETTRRLLEGFGVVSERSGP